MTTTGLFAVVAGMDARLARYGTPLVKEKLVPLNAFDKAHCVMMCEQAILSCEQAAEILKVLKKVDELGPDGFPWGKGDLWPQKERFVIAEIGEATGGRLHTGRSRQDLSATVDRLFLRPKVLAMAAQLNDFRCALVGLAAAHVETVMPCYTWMQTAQPTTLAHYLLSFAFASERSFQRILRAYQLTNKSPAGAALQTGTSHPLDRERVSELLGFDGAVRNTRDAAMHFDYLSEIRLAAALAVMDLLRLLEDFTVWHSAEFDFIALGDAWCGTSSIMPQKRNPYPFMIIRGKASRLLALASQIFNTLEGPTLGPASPFYLCEDTDAVLQEFEGIFVIAAGFLGSLRVNADKMRANVTASWAQATDLADMIVRACGLSFRTAHHIVAELVKLTSEAGLTPTGVGPSLLDEAARRVIDRPLGLSESAVRDALDPVLGVRARKVFGATAPEDVRKQIEEAQKQLQADVEQIAVHEHRLADAEARLEQTVNAALSR